MATVSEEIRRLNADLGKIPVELRREIRPALRRVAEPVLAQAKANASWSSRIPGAIRLATSFSKKRPGISLVTSARRAPHARPYEHLGSPGTFRHPVFGRDRWVEQSARPYFFKALGAAETPLVEEAGRVVEQIARNAGFR